MVKKKSLENKEYLPKSFNKVDKIIKSKANKKKFRKNTL